MIFIAGASSLSHSLETIDSSDKEYFSSITFAFFGAILNPSSGKNVFKDLCKEELKDRKIVLWHDLINNTITEHKKSQTPALPVQELVKILQKIPNLFGIVHCVRNGAPDIFAELRKLPIFVIEVTK